MTDGQIEILAPSEIGTGIRWTSTGIEVVDPLLPFETFASAVAFAGAANDAAKWALGDLLIFGQNRYGEEYAQVLASARVSDRQAERYRYVAQQVRHPRRRENLSFSHHEEVAALDPPDQDRLLVSAIDAGWSTGDLRERVRDLRVATGTARSTVSRSEGIVDALASVDAARNLSTVRTALTTVATALDPAGQEAVGIPAALRAVEEVGRTVRRAAAVLGKPTLLDAAKKVVDAAVKQKALADPAYIVPAAVFEEFAERVSESQ